MRFITSMTEASGIDLVWKQSPGARADTSQPKLRPRGYHPPEVPEQPSFTAQETSRGDADPLIASLRALRLCVRSCSSQSEDALTSQSNHLPVWPACIKHQCPCPQSQGPHAMAQRRKENTFEPLTSPLRALRLCVGPWPPRLVPRSLNSSPRRSAWQPGCIMHRRLCIESQGPHAKAQRRKENTSAPLTSPLRALRLCVRPGPPQSEGALPWQSSSLPVSRDYWRGQYLVCWLPLRVFAWHPVCITHRQPCTQSQGPRAKAQTRKRTADDPLNFSASFAPLREILQFAVRTRAALAICRSTSLTRLHHASLPLPPIAEASRKGAKEQLTTRW